MSFGDAIKSGYRNYFRLGGCATRPEYWWFQLYVVLLNVAMFACFLAGAGLVRQALPNVRGNPRDVAALAPGMIVLLVALVPVIALLASVIPMITLQVRRLHDAGQTGWWVLASSVLGPLNILYERAAKTHHEAAVIVIHDFLAAGVAVISLIILFFLVQPSARASKYDPYG